jgi:hypothetical protein
VSQAAQLKVLRARAIAAGVVPRNISQTAFNRAVRAALSSSSGRAPSPVPAMVPGSSPPFPGATPTTNVGTPAPNPFSLVPPIGIAPPSFGVLGQVVGQAVQPLADAVTGAAGQLASMIPSLPGVGALASVAAPIAGLAAVPGIGLAAAAFMPGIGDIIGDIMGSGPATGWGSLTGGVVNAAAASSNRTRTQIE